MAKFTENKSTFIFVDKECPPRYAERTNVYENFEQFVVSRN